MVARGAPGEPPLVAGRLNERSGAPLDRAGFLAFGTWLQAESAGRLDRAIARLRERGEPFTMTIAAASGRLVEAHGRTVGSSAVVRFRDLSGDRLARAEIEARYGLLLAEVEAMRAMLAAAPMPVWIRDARGRLAWVNGAYAAAVEASDPAGAITRGLELLDSPSRQLIQMAHAADPAFVGTLTGDRRRDAAH
jgi:PAS domain-containing protein